MFVRALAGDARAALSGLDEPASWGAGRGCPEPPAEHRPRSLYDYLREVPEYRSARGVRRLATVLAVAVAAKLAGARGVTAIAEVAARLTQRQLAAVRAFRSPSAKRLVPPSKTSIDRILSELDPDALDAAMRRFTAARRAPGGTLALDGKCRPLNRPGGSDAERTVTLDALHCCPKTARLIVDGGGDYVMPVKRNHAGLLDDIRILGFNSAPSRSTLDKAHGRLEQRTCAVVPLDAFDDGVAPLPGRR